MDASHRSDNCRYPQCQFDPVETPACARVCKAFGRCSGPCSDPCYSVTRLAGGGKADPGGNRWPHSSR